MSLPPPSIIRVGILHSLSGTMAISEAALKDAALMAIAEINEAGGVLGHTIEPVIKDGASEPSTFAQQSRKLIEQEQVVTLFGCWTSASRKAVLPVVEELNALLWYPVPYEGLECSANIFYTGSCINQQIEPTIIWLLQNKGNRFYLLGSNYIFPRTANKLISAQLKQHGGAVVGEDYVSMGCQAFSDVIARIQQLKPDVVFNTLNGDSNVAFYRQFQAAGIAAADIPILAVSVSEVELQNMGDSATGHYASWSYFQSINTSVNRAFVRNFQARYGADRVTSDPIQAAYYQVYLWKQAVELAQSFAVDRVRSAAYGQTFASPGGLIRLEPNHHTWKHCRIGRVLPSQQFEVVYESDRPVKPLPWLGAEELNSSHSSTVIDLLSEVSQWVQKAQELEQKSNELAAAMTQLQSEIADRQRAEAALRNSEAELRALFAAMDDVIMVFDRQGTCLRIAATDLQDLLKPTEEQVGQTVQQLLPQATATLYLNAIHSALNTQQTVSFEYDLRIGDRETCFSAKVSPLSENTVIMVSRDITNLKQAEKTVRDSEAELRSFFAAMPDAVLTLDRQGRYLKIATTQSSLLYQPAFDLLGKTVHDVFALEIADKFVSLIQQALAERQTVKVEYRLPLGGRDVWFSTTVSPLSEDTVIWVARDITDRVQAETALRNSEAELRTLFAAMNDIVAVFDRQGICLRIASTDPNDLLKPAAQQIDRTVHENLPQAAAELHLANIQQALHTRQTVSFEYSLMLGEQESWFSAKVSPLSDNTVIMVSRDITDLKQAEKAVRGSEAELRSFFAAMPDVTLVFDWDGRLLKILAPTNDQLFILPPIDQIGRTVSEILPAAQANLQIGFIRQCIQTQQAITNIEYSLSINNQELWFSATVSPLSENTVIWVARNITNLKQAEAALRQSEAKYRHLYENSQVGIFRTRIADGLIVDANPRAVKMTGYPSAEDVVGKRFQAEFSALQERRRVLSLLRQHGKVNDHEGQFRQRDGTIRWGLFSFNLNLEEDCMEAVFTDITDRKRIEEALKESQERFDRATEGSAEGIWDWDLRTNQVFFSAVWMETLGYQEGELPLELSTWSDNVHPEDLPVTLKAVQDHLDGITPVYICIFRMRHKDGRWLWIEAKGKCTRDASGTPYRLTGSQRDVSDRKQAEAALQASLSELAAANQEITLLNQRLERENLRMSAELDVTRQLQQMILPKDHELSQIHGLEISGFMEPADEVGGDYYDVLQQNGLVKIGIGDVTGHGLESGMLMLMVQTAVRTLLTNQETDSVKFLNTLNQVIYENAQRMNCDKNITLALLDYQNGRVRLSGQHEQMLVVRANGRIERVDTLSLGMPLGLVADIADFVAQMEIQLQSNDGVVLYTDGVIEAENCLEELYGLERLCQVISHHWERSVEEIRQAVIEDVHQHIGEQKVFDDITLLVLKQK